MFNLSFQQLLTIIPAILIAITFHEFAHGRVAMLLGDNTPELTGRNTLNPLKHLDPVGFLLLMVVGFGWAKPVMINPNNFKNFKRDTILVALAGPTANFILAFIFTLLYKILVINLGIVFVGLYNFIFYSISINLALMVFNLLPIPPLDGSRIILNLIPNSNSEMRLKYYRYGSWAFLALIVIDRMTPINLLPIRPVVMFFMRLLFSLVGVDISA
ncbi:MAG: site-2 protease family protein [Spirochaetaceae bacterium]|jgi:Zn-dependent protease|nr:site-2 protease family protein [Spirochaetaceae bacterium]